MQQYEARHEAVRYSWESLFLVSFHCILLLLHSALGVMERHTCLLSASHDSRFDLKLVCVFTKHLITFRLLSIKRSHGIIVTLFS